MLYETNRASEVYAIGKRRLVIVVSNREIASEISGRFQKSFDRADWRGDVDPALRQCAELHFHLLFVDGVYVDAGDRVRFRRVPPPTAAALEKRVQVISERVGRALERNRLLVRDLENPCLTLDSHDESGFDELLGHSITYRIALGPHQGRKAFTLQTVSAAAEFSDGKLARAAGLSLPAGVATEAHEREKLEHYVPGRIDRALVARGPGQCSLSTKNPLPGWQHGRDVRTTRLHCPVGGTGADAAGQLHALPRNVRAEQPTA